MIRYRYIVSTANMVKDTRTAAQIEADAKNRFKEAEAVRKKAEGQVVQQLREDAATEKAGKEGKFVNAVSFHRTFSRGSGGTL